MKDECDCHHGNSCLVYKGLYPIIMVITKGTLIDAYAILPFLAEVILLQGKQLMENTTISLSACQDKVVFHWQSHQQV